MKKVGQNEPCPCGSGKKYKNCCWNKGFDWVRDSEGQIHKEIPISDELQQEFQKYFAQFREQYGRDIEPDEYIFSGLELPQMEADMILLLKQAGVPPALIYAYEKTGRFVTEKNKRFLTDQELKEWDDAVEEYYERYGG